MRSTVLASILGGLIAYVWVSISWMALTWHHQGLHSLADENAVAQVLLANAPASGIYLLPNTAVMPNNTHPEMAEQAMQAAMQKMQAGPSALIAFTREGIDTSKHMAQQMGMTLLLYVVMAWFMVCLLRRTQGLHYFQRVSFIVTLAILMALAQLPYFIWWHFSVAFVLVTVADILIGWLLAALLMARLVPGKAAGLSFR